jgi:hypothetical protein
MVELQTLATMSAVADQLSEPLGATVQAAIEESARNLPLPKEVSLVFK